MRPAVLGMIIAAAMICGDASAQPPAPDWTNSSKAWSFSFRNVGWDLTANVRPEVVSPDFTIEIMRGDKTPLFCHVMEQVIPQALAKDPLAAATHALVAKYPLGAIVDDRLGGSRVLASEVRMAGEIPVFYLSQETLDQKRPLLRQQRLQFAVVEESITTSTMIECFVGFGAPQNTWGELDQVLGTLRIKGAPLAAPQ